MNIILPNGNTFVAGNDVSIQCDVRGYPRPYVTWTRDDVEIRESQRIRISGKLEMHFIHSRKNAHIICVVFIADANTLTIYGITTDDAGHYKCLAQNRFGSSHHVTQINVEGKIKI